MVLYQKGYLNTKDVLIQHHFYILKFNYFLFLVEKIPAIDANKELTKPVVAATPVFGETVLVAFLLFIVIINIILVYRCISTIIIRY